jgi:hypothetical protein
MPNYLYNGREMPELPNGFYPYWFIMENKYVPENPILVNSQYALYRHVNDDGSSHNYYTEKSKYFSYTIADGAWSNATAGGPRDNEAYGFPVIWSNHDILYADGSLFFAASDPVPVPDEPEPDEPDPVLSWQKHDAYKPNSNSIAYLYNGVELPDINTVWTDKATYPYAMITRSIHGGICSLDVCGNMPYYTERSYSGESYEPAVVASPPSKHFAIVDGSWELSLEFDSDYSGLSYLTGTFELIWTNVDVMNKDNGSVYFNGSDPVIKGWDGNTFYRVMGGKWVKQETYNSQVVVDPVPIPDDCLTFSSAEPFTIAVNNAQKNWDGALEVSTDNSTWSEWDGTTAIESEAHGTEERIYMRGRGNTDIVGSYLDSHRWVLTGNNVSCHGNIETLLDYETVSNGDHPPMADACYVALFSQWKGLIKAPELGAISMTAYCYKDLFRGCDNLLVAPELPATTLADRCYYGMFNGCDRITVAPKLPVTNLCIGCYIQMFANCYGLTIPPELPSENLEEHCYVSMFANCTGLVALPKLKATTLEHSCYESMFSGCTSIKLSETQTGEYQTPYRIPTSGTGVVMHESALWWMFEDTGGTFVGEADISEQGTPKINKTYYTSNTVV